MILKKNYKINFNIKFIFLNSIHNEVWIDFGTFIIQI